MSTLSPRVRRLAVVIWSLLTAALLLAPAGDDPPVWGLWDWLDKPMHVALFAVLCWVLALALVPSLPNRPAAGVAFLVSGLYGVLLEALQIPVPGRFWDAWDVAADLAGAAFAALLFARSRARLRGGL